jgi:hypothetical protein
MSLVYGPSTGFSSKGGVWLKKPPDAESAIGAGYTVPKVWANGCACPWGAGLLFLVSMLFVGLLVFFILQPFVADVPFSADDFIAIAVMSVFCFIPLGLFLRGIWKAVS